jgi:alpha-galactosidase
MRILALIAVALVTTLSACATHSAPATLSAHAGSVAADRDGLARTPPMGWDPWNAYGCAVSAKLIEQTAKTMVADGMKAAGYEYVNIDDCWPASKRDASGRLVPDPSRFPGGIKSVADYVHHLGLKLGIYADAGTSMCGGTAPGSYGHEAKDAATFASWGVDYVKYDACNIPFHDYPGESREQVYKTLYKRMSAALAATRRPIVFSMCNGWDPAARPWSWGAAISNLWRTTADISDSYLSMLSNFDGNVGLYRYAGPGHWNDPDMLEIGNGGESTLEYQTEFSLWSEMAAPLIAGTSIAHLSPADLAIYENRRVIAVDQDPLGKQGVPVASSHGLWVLSKRLADGSRAVVLFNSTDTAAPIATTAAAVGLPTASVYQLHDLWTSAVTETGGRISAFVSAHGVAMYRVSPVSATDAGALPPATALSLVAASAQLRAGAATTVTESFTNNGVLPVQQVRMSSAVPSGWTSTPLGGGELANVGPGRTATTSFRVTAPGASAPLAIADLTAAVTYSVDGQALASSATLGQTLVSELPGPWAAADTTAAPAIYGHLRGAFAIKSSGTGVGSASASVIPPIVATDSYAAIYKKRAAGSRSTARVTVTSDAGLGEWAGAGLIERRAMDAPAGSPETITLFIDVHGAIGMTWNRTGGAKVDSAVRLDGLALKTPVSLKLVRSGRTFTGYYSTDGGSRWVKVQTVTVAARAAAGRLDAGMFHASGSGRFATEADFSNFSVS